MSKGSCDQEAGETEALQRPRAIGTERRDSRDGGDISRHGGQTGHLSTWEVDTGGPSA